ncbi:MAG TPA: thioredoxin domain-containing protein, partial [Acidimicrobiales bacterium]
FARARAEDKPIFLSVGYSSCHWCHVMAHESFEDPATAQLMNDLFVNVKVDREERPDVDAIYMEAVQAMTGQGGWPMTVFLTPDARPFFAGTYFPKSPRHGMPSFTQILESVHDVWRTRRDDVDRQADQLTAAISRRVVVSPDASLPPPDALETAAGALRKQYDAAWGGFGGAPKFPQTMALEALLRVYAHTHDLDVLHMVTNSLDAMASGGIYDHLGGGFARYSVDARWIVPHFEKMLYDNALLARVFLHAWQVTGKQRFRQVADETIQYLLRDLHRPDGGFYSAEDADSEGEEGKFYVFTLDEVRTVLADAGLGEHADEVIAWYGVTEHGNFEGRNILFRPDRGDLLRPAVIERARQVLLEHRNRRVRPGLDDKVLTEWNGLALATLAEAAAATGDATLLAEAVRTGEFLCANLRQGDRWLRSWQADAGARHLGYAADYAALVDAFVRLAEATGQSRWIAEAVRTADGMLERFWDHDDGGLFTTGDDAEQLVTRPKDLLDNATPSANSLAAVGLQRLAALTGIERYRERAEDILRLIGSAAAEHPTAFGNLLAAIDLHTTGITEIVVPGDRADLVSAVQQRYLPNAVLAWGEPYDSPLWENRDQPAAYVCRNYTCLAPATDVDTLIAQL